MNKYTIVQYMAVCVTLLFSACSESTGTNNAHADSSQPNTSGSSDTGKGGSTSRFTIIDDFLYVVQGQESVNGRSTIKSFDIAADAPVLIEEVSIFDEVETVFPYQLNGQKMLLIGAQGAMYIYPIGMEGKIMTEQQAQLSHARSCDPVVAHGNYAYVTLRQSTEGNCITGSNELQVMDISSIDSPQKINSQMMVGPKGLAVSDDGQWLWVCDADALQQLSLENPEAPVITRSYSDIQCNDVISYQGYYFITGSQLLQLYQLDENRLVLQADLLAD